MLLILFLQGVEMSRSVGTERLLYVTQFRLLKDTLPLKKTFFKKVDVQTGSPIPVDCSVAFSEAGWLGLLLSMGHTCGQGVGSCSS